MKHQHIIAIRRDYIYSLEAEQKDRDILVAVMQQLGEDIRMVDELKLAVQDEAELSRCSGVVCAKKSGAGYARKRYTHATAAGKAWLLAQKG